MKIAFDENVPAGMVRVFQTFASEHQLRKLIEGVEVTSAREYAPRRLDADYLHGSDVPWLKRFAADGGRVVISGDTEMRRSMHERLALIQLGFVVIFFNSQWANWKFFRKCALLLNWWPHIALKIKTAKQGSFWAVPCNWAEHGRLQKLSTKDPRLLKIERRAKAQRNPSSRQRKVESADSGHGPLFEFHSAKRSKTVTNDDKSAVAERPDTTK